MRDAVVLESGHGVLEIPISVQLPTVTLMAKSEAVLDLLPLNNDGEPYSGDDARDLEACLDECGWFDFSCNAGCLLNYGHNNDKFQYKFVDSVEDKIEGLNSGELEDALKIYVSPDAGYDLDTLFIDLRVEVVSKLRDADIAIKSHDEEEHVSDCLDVIVSDPRGADRLDVFVPEGDTFAFRVLVDSVADIYAA